MSKYIIYNGELYHYGRIGMKWGQHIFGKDNVKSVGRVKSSNTKNRLGSKNIFADVTKNFKPTKNEFGWYNDIETTVNIGKNKNVPVYVDYKEGMDIANATKKASNFIKKYDDNKMRNFIAKEFFDKRKPWSNDDGIKFTRKEFMNEMKLDSIGFDSSGSTYEVYYYDGGVSYGGHIFTVEGSTDTGKPNDIYLWG